MSDPKCGNCGFCGDCLAPEAWSALVDYHLDRLRAENQRLAGRLSEIKHEVHRVLGGRPDENYLNAARRVVAERDAAWWREGEETL